MSAYEAHPSPTADSAVSPPLPLWFWDCLSLNLT